VCMCVCNVLMDTLVCLRNKIVQNGCETKLYICMLNNLFYLILSHNSTHKNSNFKFSTLLLALYAKQK
jgi:hypothetical protein